MSHWEPRPGLDVEVAKRVAVPTLRRVLDMLQDEAQRRAPEVKVWVTMRDERVRTSHRDTDAQAVPANLRFRVPKADGGEGHDLAREPRDPNLPAGNRINCRCDTTPLPALLRDSITQTLVTQTGTRVSGSIETRFPRAAESEFGGDGDDGAYFMRGALDEVALKLRSGHAR